MRVVDRVCESPDQRSPNGQGHCRHCACPSFAGSKAAVGNVAGPPPANEHAQYRQQRPFTACETQTRRRQPGKPAARGRARPLSALRMPAVRGKARLLSATLQAHRSQESTPLSPTAPAHQPRESKPTVGNVSSPPLAREHAAVANSARSPVRKQARCRRPHPLDACERASLPSATADAHGRRGHGTAVRKRARPLPWPSKPASRGQADPRGRQTRRPRKQPCLPRTGQARSRHATRPAPANPATAAADVTDYGGTACPPARQSGRTCGRRRVPSSGSTRCR